MSAGINQLIASFRGLNVLVVGDVMLDTYLWGSVDRISPESPVPVVDYRSQSHRLGGAANVALNVRSLGARPFLGALVGDDPESEIFRSLAAEAGLGFEGMVVSKERPTTHKTRILSRNHQLLRIDRELQRDLSQAETHALMERIKDILANEKIHVAIFQDYNKGVLSSDLISLLIPELRRANVKIAVDPKKKNFFGFKDVDLFKPNLREITQMVDFEIDSEDKASLVRASTFIREKIGNRMTLITLSDKGAFLDAGTTSGLIPAHKIRYVSDVSGAGDTVISVAALCLALDAEPMLMARLANMAGGLVCEQVGVTPIDHKRFLEEAINHF